MISARTTQNGLFSFKWNSDFEKIPFAREIYERLKPQHHILVDRRDVRAQTMSFAKSRKTGQWVTTTSSKMERRRRDVTQLELLRARFRLWMIRTATSSYQKTRNVNVLAVDYEDLLEAPKETLSRIFDHCGETPPADLPTKAVNMVKSRP
ncbi:MAG: Stf0 family sulfotransferase [Paracoccaceae bacterium]|nr:Stf0 family sulfotransferase [Paracoccaceae bacterium]